jgi:hypothetical protein
MSKENQLKRVESVGKTVHAVSNTLGNYGSKAAKWGTIAVLFGYALTFIEEYTDRKRIKLRKEIRNEH